MNGWSTNRSRATGSKMMAGFAIAVLAAGSLVGCGDDDDASAAIEVSGAWARTSPAMANAGAAYMVISSADGATVVAASVDPDVAGVTEFHEVVPAEGAMGDMADGEMDHGGMDGEMAMMMREVASIEVPAGGSVTLEPGGLHVMLLELLDPLETGEEFDVTLTLGDDTEVVVPVTVRENAP